MRQILPILALLLGMLSGAGCSPSIVPPALPEGSLIPGTAGSRFLARVGQEVWWTSDRSSDIFRADAHTGRPLPAFRSPQTYPIFDLAEGLGKVWLAQGGIQPSVHRIDPKGQRSAATAKLTSFWGQRDKQAYLTVGDHAVWAAVNVRDKVFRIDPSTLNVTSIPLEKRPLNNQVGRLVYQEGTVWVIQNDLLSGIDSRACRVTVDIPVPGLFAPVGTLAVGGGSVWVASGGPVVTRVDPRTPTIVNRINVNQDPSTAPNMYGIASMAASADTLWVLAARFAGRFFEPTYARFELVELDLRTNAVRRVRQLGAGDATGLFGPCLAVTDGIVWTCLPAGVYVIGLPAASQKAESRPAGP